MNDYMLKFASQQEAETVLLQLGLVQELEGRIAPVQTHAVDIIGTIHKPDGTFTQTEEGMSIPNFMELEGYHVNVRTNGTFEQLNPYTVTPSTPHRVWA